MYVHAQHMCNMCNILPKRWQIAKLATVVVKTGKCKTCSRFTHRHSRTLTHSPYAVMISGCALLDAVFDLSFLGRADPHKQKGGCVRVVGRRFVRSRGASCLRARRPEKRDGASLHRIATRDGALESYSLPAWLAKNPS